MRKGKPLPDLKARIVILVDDGIATGATMLAAIKMCKNGGAAKIVVGVPVSGKMMARQLKSEVDEVVILETPEDFHAVSQAYLSFKPVTDGEASELLEQWENEKQSAGRFPSA